MKWLLLVTLIVSALVAWLLVDVSVVSRYLKRVATLSSTSPCSVVECMRAKSVCTSDEKLAAFYDGARQESWREPGVKHFKLHEISWHFCPQLVFIQRSEANLDDRFHGENNTFISPTVSIHSLCQNAVLRPGVKEKLICGGKVPLGNQGRALVGFDPFSAAFQHQLINALPTVAMGLYFLTVYQDIVVLCEGLICDLVDAFFPSANRTLKFSRGMEYFFAELFFPFQYLGSEPLRQELYGKPAIWDAFPTGFQSQLESLRNSFMKKLGCELESTSPYVLYLQRSRGHKRQLGVFECSLNCSCQVLGEKEVVRRLRNAALEIGLELKIFSHKLIHHDVALIAGAKILIGPHGGAFSNIAFARPDAIVCEVNRPRGRDCFASMAVQRGMMYYQLNPEHWIDYRAKGKGMYISQERFIGGLKAAARGSFPNSRSKCSLQQILRKNSHAKT